MTNWQRGDLVELDGLLAVVVGIEGDPNVPEEHIAAWFGAPSCIRKSKGGAGAASPEVWTVPAYLFVRAAEPDWRH
ncbi:uncharacterized protein POS17_3528 [Pseudomonas sp. Os17]|uniref:Uncharacterized protein n=1 Tax=Pseudomonas protegens TaxID=380021 RepID=A0A2T6GG59_9PSED|nr:hypothetical protein C5U62_21085 [Pseudomonas protegens]RXU67828.1 hypothetical protein CW358_07015 [Pseudomonas protegens]BAQ75222.1 uncharacterized protein POS17_3528 [Pseudomonas sp. Os17]BAQ81475.1 uncharacterized protein PST29_3586 [Pseudomonas sp. St29]